MTGVFLLQKPKTVSKSRTAVFYIYTFPARVCSGYLLQCKPTGDVTHYDKAVGRLLFLSDRLPWNTAILFPVWRAITQKIPSQSNGMLSVFNAFGGTPTDTSHTVRTISIPTRPAADQPDII